MYYYIYINDLLSVDHCKFWVYFGANVIIIRPTCLQKLLQGHLTRLIIICLLLTTSRLLGVFRNNLHCCKSTSLQTPPRGHSTDRYLYVLYFLFTSQIFNLSNFILPISLLTWKFQEKKSKNKSKSGCTYQMMVIISLFYSYAWY